ncbi:MAG: hypothetical protein ACFFG0_33870 [Candidatus Thorarchaeota archaeon]
MENWIQKVNNYKDLLSINDVNINLIVSSSKTSIRFDQAQQIYILNINESCTDYDLIHELGHIHLTKKTGCLILSSPPVIEDLDDNILGILDYLINNLVNFRVSIIDDFYPLYREFFLNAIQYRYDFTSILEELAFYIWMQIESIFILNPSDKNLELMKYMAFHKQLLNQKTSFSNSKYEELLLNLHSFDQVKYSDEAEDIINYLSNITHLICSMCEYQNENYIDIQMDLIFSNCY